jgi:hypothetical protein
MNISNTNSFIMPVAQPKPTVPIKQELPEAPKEKQEKTELSNIETLKVSKEVQEGKVEAYKAGAGYSNDDNSTVDNKIEIDDKAKLEVMTDEDSLSDMGTLKVAKEVQEGKIEAYKAGTENANQVQKSYNTSEDIDTSNSVKVYMDFAQDVKRAEGLQTYNENKLI